MALSTLDKNRLNVLMGVHQALSSQGAEDWEMAAVRAEVYKLLEVAPVKPTIPEWTSAAALDATAEAAENADDHSTTEKV